MKKETKLTGLEIAVIGMSGRFPGADNIWDFWRNMADGVESVKFFTPLEYEAIGFPPELLDQPGYVGAFGYLAGKDQFDSSFFGYTPREAEVLDPQYRILHEVVWEALEHGGYGADHYDGSIGMYVGASGNFYWQARTVVSGLASEMGEFEANLLSNKDLLSTRLSYKFDLRGPSVTVSDACSTSMVAIHLAARALLTGECDMALAGGICALFPNNYGYWYSEGMIHSPDGHCRAFDAASGGTVFGEGAGIVLLKRFTDALKHGDTVHAVIKGSAVNNDGRVKVGYTAPSVQGQAEVIRKAHKNARVSQESITYIEAHGTGTQMGDTMEMEAMIKAFNTDRKNFCAVASVKSNIGHLDVAAGVVGFIRAVLALKHKRIPPSLHFITPNPNINFANSPFFINTRLLEWRNDEYPLRAGVNSFGIGGTNVHVVLEETPAAALPLQRDPALISGGYRLLTLSAATPTALDALTTRMAQYLETRPQMDVNDVAYTLQTGRKHFKYRRFAVCNGTQDAVDRLTAEAGSGKLLSGDSGLENRPLVFLFSGQGTQHVNMGRELYDKEPFFRETMDMCFAALDQIAPFRLKEILYPAADRDSRDREPLNNLDVALPAIFIVEYSLARLLLKWGYTPKTMLGYSFGEYVAAAVAGVFSITDALTLVVERSRLVASLSGGVLLSVPVPKDRLISLLEYQPNLSFAIDNGASCIVGGPETDIAALEIYLKQQRLISMRLGSTHAVHTHMMEPVCLRFKQLLAGLTLNPPRIPYISNVTGKPVTPEQAVDPDHWVDHLRKTVLFNDAVEYLTDAPEHKQPVFVEIGAGRDLCTMVARSADGGSRRKVVNLLPVPNPKEKESDLYYLLNKIGFLWLYGIAPHWPALYGAQINYRVPLPTYPFEGVTYKVENVFEGFAAPAVGSGDRPLRTPDTGRWFYQPSWKPALLPMDNPSADAAVHAGPGTWLVFAAHNIVTRTLTDQFIQKGERVVFVVADREYRQTAADRFTLNPQRPDDYARLFGQLKQEGKLPDRIVHLWNTRPPAGNTAGDVTTALHEDLEYGFYSLVHIVRELKTVGFESELQITVVSAGMREVAGEGVPCPGRAALLGPIKVIPQENLHIRCRSIDLPVEGNESLQERWGQMVYRELCVSPVLLDGEPEVAYRGGRRFSRHFDPLSLAPVDESKQAMPIKQKGVYLITGGTGNIGLVVAQYLAHVFKARIVLVGRTPLPPRAQWQAVIDEGGDTAQIKTLNTLQLLESLGSRVLTFAADVSRYPQMAEVLEAVESEFGPVDGVFHAAGVLSGPSFIRVHGLTQEACAPQFKANLDALPVLDKLFASRPLDFCVVFSSISCILGGITLAAYTAGNFFMNAFCRGRGESAPTTFPWICIDWEPWVFDPAVLGEGLSAETMAVGPMEGVEVLRRVLARTDLQEVTVSVAPLQPRIDFWVKLETLRADDDAAGAHADGESAGAPRPELMTPFAAPRTENEKIITGIWERLFGFSGLGVHDNFFELGGDSLKILNVISKIHKMLKVEIALHDIFENPTIEGIAQLLDSGKSSDYIPVTPAPQREHYPLSAAQKRLFIIQQMEADHTGYNEAIVIQMDGNVSVERLEYAFRCMIQRHESLRTSFHIIDDEPVQKVHGAEAVPFALQSADALGRDGGVDAILAGFSGPIDLSAPPLFKAILIRSGENESIVAVEIHHIISDGISYQIFERELRAFFRGADDTLAPLTLQYKDYAYWQNSDAQKQYMAAQGDYWLERFGDEIPRLNLPLDFPRPEVKSFDGAAIRFTLPPEHVRALYQSAAREGATLFMVLMTVFYTLLHKLTSQQDIVVGTPVFGRRQEELMQVIGIFVNTLALRNCPTPDKTFKHLLVEVKTNTLDAFANQDFQFDQLTETLNIKRDTSRNPVFDVLFNLQNEVVSDFHEAPGNVPATTDDSQPHMVEVEHRLHQAQFDLLLFANESNSDILFKMVYCDKLFKRETVERFCHYFKEIVAAVCENPRLPLKDIKISHQLGVAKVEMPDTDFDF